MSITQQDRFLRILIEAQEPDDFMLVNFSGSEGISRLFSYQLEVLSEKEDVKPADVIGKKIAWSLQHGADERRYFKGYISRFIVGGRGLYDMFSYRIEVVPWLWFLRCTANCRIFQHKTVEQIIEILFGEFGFSDYKIELTGSHPEREYCVQYRETAFNFISRLMEDEGIYFYFNHEKGKPGLMIADAPDGYTEFDGNSVHLSSDSQPHDHISSWEHQFEFCSGKYAHTDYNFKTPSTDLLAEITTGITDVPDFEKFELFDYPGEYPTTGDGESRAEFRIQEEEAAYHTVTGSGNCTTFTTGGRFQIADTASEEGKTYVLTSVHHSGSDTSFGNNGGDSDYHNNFVCIPADVKYRPPRTTPKPVVHGTQTAVVVGPAGEEIYTDKYSRIKVQFHWDRLGKLDEKSSCWVRVSSIWAGKGFGIINIPRIGQEVVVDFLEGDPDQPLVIGSVYNAVQMPPMGLPGAKMIGGLKSNCYPGGGGYNGLIFDDSKGKEMVTFHAQKDNTLVVENDETTTVHHDRTETVDNNETITIHGNRTETVDKDETITVHQNRTETVDQNETITVHQNRTETVDINETITVGADRTRTVNGNETITVAMMRTHTVGINEAITVGAAQEVTVGAARSVTVGGSQAVTIGSSQTITVGGGQALSVGKDLGEKVGGNHGVKVAGDNSIDVGKNFALTAADSITLKTGDASIIMKKDGTITIKGKDITVNGSGEINAKASKNITMKGQKIAQN